MSPDFIEPRVSFPSVAAFAADDHAARLALENRTIHLWGFSLDGSAAVFDRFQFWLSDEERTRAGRFIQREDQTRYTLAHGALRAVLSRYIGLDPSVLRFVGGVTGKPALVNQNAIRFNLSHSHGRMLIAVAQEQDVGVDLEQIREKVEVVKLAERFYAPAEYQQVSSRTGSDQARQFYRYWVAKEALVKGQGIGLSSLPQCEISSDESLSRAVAKVPPDSAIQSGWTIRWLDCGTGWQGAVSASGSDWAVQIVNALSSP